MIKIGNKINSNNLSNNLFDINKSNNDNKFGSILTNEINYFGIENLSIFNLSNYNPNNNEVSENDLSINFFNNYENEKLNISSLLTTNDIISNNDFKIVDKKNCIKDQNNNLINKLDINENNENPIIGNDLLKISASNLELNNYKINNLLINSTINQNFNEDDIIDLQNSSIKIENKTLNKYVKHLIKFSDINDISHFANDQNLVNNLNNKDNQTLQDNPTILKDNLNYNYKSYNKINNESNLIITNSFDNFNSENLTDIDINFNYSNKQINNNLNNQSKVNNLNTNNANINKIANIGDNLLSDEISENNFKQNLNTNFSQNIELENKVISSQTNGEKYINNFVNDNLNNSIINNNEFTNELNLDNTKNQNPNNDLSKKFEPKLVHHINKNDDYHFFSNILDNLKTNNLVIKDVNNIDKSLNINNYNLSFDDLKENLIKFIKYEIKDENFKAKINLQPKSLGNLLIEITQNQGNINIQFNVDNQDTGKLIDNTLYNFKERLIQSGILNNNNDVNINIQLNLTNYNQNENQKNNNKQSKVNKKYNIETIRNTITEKDSNTKIYNKYNGGKIVEKYI